MTFSHSRSPNEPSMLQRQIQSVFKQQLRTSHRIQNYSRQSRSSDFQLKTKQSFIQYHPRWVTCVFFRCPIFVSNYCGLSLIIVQKQTNQTVVRSIILRWYFRYSWILGVIGRQKKFSCVLMRNEFYSYLKRSKRSRKRWIIYDIVYVCIEFSYFETANMLLCKFVVLKWENNVRDVTVFASHSNSCRDESFSFRSLIFFSAESEAFEQSRWKCISQVTWTLMWVFLSQMRHDSYINSLPPYDDLHVNNGQTIHE